MVLITPIAVMCKPVWAQFQSVPKYLMVIFLICVTACERVFFKNQKQANKKNGKNLEKKNKCWAFSYYQFNPHPVNSNAKNWDEPKTNTVFLCLNFTHSTSEPWPVSLLYDFIRLQWSLKSINLIHPLLSFFSVFRFILRSEVAAAAPGHQDDSHKHSESDSVTQIADGASYCEVDSIWVRKRVMTIKGQLWHQWSLTDFFLYQRKMFDIFNIFKVLKKYKRLNWLLILLNFDRICRTASGFIGINVYNLQSRSFLCFPDFFLRHRNLDICGGSCWIKSLQISFSQENSGCCHS